MSEVDIKFDRLFNVSFIGGKGNLIHIGVVHHDHEDVLKEINSIWKTKHVWAIDVYDKNKRIFSEKRYPNYSKEFTEKVIEIINIKKLKVESKKKFDESFKLAFRHNDLNLSGFNKSSEFYSKFKMFDDVMLSKIDKLNNEESKIIFDLNFEQNELITISKNYWESLEKLNRAVKDEELLGTFFTHMRPYKIHQLDSVFDCK